MTDLDDLLSRHGLTRDTTTAYIDAVIRMNMSQTAAELDVSTDTVHRYKRALARMTEEERAFLIATLFQEKILGQQLDR